MSDHTPLMQQYFAIKQEYPDALLLFQVGDFYEFFFDDAHKAAALLNITLTKRGKNPDGTPIPLCGVPVHTVDHYITKLIRGGFKVALCDQLEAATPGKMVARGVTRVLTPGTLTALHHLDPKKASYIFSFFPLEHSWGFLFGELMTAQLFGTVIESPHDKFLDTELGRFFPDEIILPDTPLGKKFNPYFMKQGYFTTLLAQEQDLSMHVWLDQHLDRVDAACDKEGSLRKALMNFHAYMRKTNQQALENFHALQWYQPEDFLLLDRATQKNLELLENQDDGGKAHTLFGILDGAVTAMGSRTIKKWILSPSRNREVIEGRHAVVQEFMVDRIFAERVENLLHAFGDLERVVGRIAVRRASLQDYLHLRNGLAALTSLKMLLYGKKEILLCALLLSMIDDFTLLQTLLTQALPDDALQDSLIKAGFHAELDRLRELVRDGASRVLALEKKEQEATGINSLKIRDNNVHGLYIEITKTHYDAIPKHYVRRQSLVGRERFTTAELQALEYARKQADDDSKKLESRLFDDIKELVAQKISQLRFGAQACAWLDGLFGFAAIAYRHRYVRPLFHATRDIVIKQGRHPIVEQALGTKFIPNDTLLDAQQSLYIITGPNMGGKSTYLRQVALIHIMAQAGAFVPAQEASLPLLERIFTRIGAGDSLATGRSTFMVEMEEVATICTFATPKSLVILDEVGRGTSTIDGLALAQAIIEFLYKQVKAPALFATHYHELTALPPRFPGMVNYYTSSLQTQGGILFLHKIVPGVATGSFGIEVAKLAKVPAPIVARAQELVYSFGQVATYQSAYSYEKGQAYEQAIDEQKKLLQDQDDRIKFLSSIDYDNLSPKRAFDILWELKEMAAAHGKRNSKSFAHDGAPENS